MKTLKSIRLNSVTDFAKAVQDLSNTASELEALSASVRRLTSAPFSMNISDGGSESPAAAQVTSMPPDELKRLREAYQRARNAHTARSQTQSLRTLADSQFGDEKSIPTHMKQLDNLMSRFDEIISKEFAKLNSASKKYSPEVLTKVVNQFTQLLQHSVSYDSIASQHYAFVDTAGDSSEEGLYFSHYIHLGGLLDEVGKSYQNVFLVLTLRDQDQTLFAAVLQEFEPPSVDLLVRPVNDALNPGKAARNAMAAFGHLLELDGFENSLGSLPIKLSQNLSKENFSAKEFIYNISYDTNRDEVIFKTSVTKQEQASALIQSLYPEFKSIVDKKKFRLRVRAIRAANGRFNLHFFLRQASDTLKVTEEDLQFLNARFNLNQDALVRIAKVINSQG